MRPGRKAKQERKARALARYRADLESLVARYPDLSKRPVYTQQEVGRLTKRVNEASR